MAVIPFSSLSKPNAVARRREAQFAQFHEMLQAFLEGQHDKNLVEIDVSRRPRLERFVHDTGLPDRLITLIGGTRKVDAFKLAAGLDLSSNVVEIHSGELYVDWDGALYLRESIYRRFSLGTLMPRTRPYRVTLMQVYRMRLLNRVISRMAYLPKSA